MHARYTDKKEITPEIRGLITQTLCLCFDDVSDLKKVAREQVGDDIYDNINWNDGNERVYSNLVSQCARAGKIGVLLEQAQKLDSDSWRLEQLTWRLVRSGYLTDICGLQ
jgi:hypothetical protein